MKTETKSFFVKDNRLNKGYDHDSSKESDKIFFRKRFEHLFPSADTLQAFEDLHPGSVDRIISMAEKEQKDRLKLEVEKAKMAEGTARVQSIVNIFIIALLAATVVILSVFASQNVAISIVLSVTAIKFLIYKKNFGKHPRHVKHSNFRRNNISKNR